MSKSASSSLLLKQYKDLTDPKRAMPSFRIELKDGNIYVWNVAVMILNKESIYHGGYFKAEMRFPSDYPFNPPTFRFLRPLFHPNVYPKDGGLCVSILHSGVDATSGEAPSERWSPAQSVESVLVSILSLLEDPNPDSPANVDAAVAFRNDREKYNNTVRRQVEKSKEDIPAGFKIPESEVYAAPQTEDEVDDEFWYEDAETDDDSDEVDASGDDDDEGVANFDGSDDEDVDMEDSEDLVSGKRVDTNETSLDSDTETTLMKTSQDRKTLSAGREPLTPAPENEKVDLLRETPHTKLDPHETDI
ncbi:ubiquitin-conjugating enzyme/RWD-like protein [Lipomyces orientalis]|uniref:Ubiquitin-conjugating enzyme/RWD-like protein n=1 Tax=Lipomyces orientalis TaxID=1233043 RepID=A0ACC3TDF5_9ASCO